MPSAFEKYAKIKVLRYASYPAARRMGTGNYRFPLKAFRWRALSQL
jgi:hypothetical protein